MVLISERECKTKISAALPRLSLKDGVPEADAHVGVHVDEAVVLHQAGLDDGDHQLGLVLGGPLGAPLRLVVVLLLQ